MTALQETDRLFFDETGMNKGKVKNIVTDGLYGSDGGELFLERTFSESLGWGEQKLTTNNFEVQEGFGLRFIAGEAFAFATSNELTEAAIKNAADTVKGIKAHASGGTIQLPKSRIRTPYYSDANPLLGMDKSAKIKILQDVEDYLLSRDERVKLVNAGLAGSVQSVQIIRADGHRVADVRPMVRFNVGVTVEENGRRESGSYSFGGRLDYKDIFNEAALKKAADEALRKALTNLRSVPAKAGETDIVMDPGWCGVMLHEAVGHGLEGDANRIGASVFSGKIGQQVAAKGVTVIDQGDIKDRRGSLNFDDEGIKTRENVLIEDGVLRSYMQDQMNARLMGQAVTGNGRRQDFRYAPIPRMTNTFMASGAHEPEEIIKSVKDGVYAVSFGGGQVDTTSGKFVFEMTEAYPIKDGKVVDQPLKGATLIGNGPDAMKKVVMIGNDSKLDPGTGTCGKAGQGVPVGIGQPTVRVNGLGLGGTE